MSEENAARALELLEAKFSKFAEVKFDREESTGALRAFDELYGTGGFLAQGAEFEAFCEKRAGRLACIYNRYRSLISCPAFLFRPEALMIFQLLEIDKFRLREAWAKLYPIRELERLAVSWGTPYAT